MSTQRAKYPVSKFPLGINTDLSLNTIRDGELGGDSRNVRITKDFYIEKESGYKTIPVFPYYNLTNKQVSIKDLFGNLFLDLNGLIDWTIDSARQDFPKFMYETLKTFLETNALLGQNNIFRFLENRDVSLGSIDKKLSSLRNSKQTMTQEILESNVLFAFPTDAEIQWVKIYSAIASNCSLITIRQLISFKWNETEDYKVHVLVHNRIEPNKGIHIIRLVLQDIFEDLRNQNAMIKYNDLQKYIEEIATLFISFSISKSEILPITSKTPISFYIDKDNVFSATFYDGNDYIQKFYKFDNESSTSILKEELPYTPRVEEILSTDAGFGGFNIINPLKFSEITEENFVFYGQLFTQQDKFYGVNTIYAGQGNAKMKLLVGLDTTKTYSYDVKVRYNTQVYDPLIDAYRDSYSDPVDLTTGTLNNAEPFIEIDITQLTANKGRFDLRISEGATFDEDAIVSTNNIPFIIVSQEPRDYTEEYSAIVRSTNFTTFGTRSVRFGYKNWIFISDPLNSTYYNISLKISNMQEGERITDIKEFADGNLIIFSQFRCWKLFSVTGDISNPTTWSIQILSDNIGSAFTYGTISVNQILFIIGQDGIYALNKSVYSKEDQYFKRVDKYTNRAAGTESTIENFYKTLIKKDIISVKTDVRNRDFETYFITFDSIFNKYVNYRIKWSVDGNIQRWLIDEDSESYNISGDNFRSCLDIVDTVYTDGTKVASTLNGSLVQFDDDYYQYIDKTYVMKFITKNFNFGNDFNLKKVKEVDFVLFTNNLQTQNIRFEHRLGAKITTANITGQDIVYVDDADLVQIKVDDIKLLKDYDKRSQEFEIFGELVIDKSTFNKETFDTSEMFHSRVRILGSNKDTTSGIAFYSESPYTIRVGGILFHIALKDKIKGKRTYVGAKNNYTIK